MILPAAMNQSGILRIGKRRGVFVFLNWATACDNLNARAMAGNSKSKIILKYFVLA